MPAPLYLTRLVLAPFRNHAASRLDPGQARFVVLTGPNGAGKTNILEAASLLAFGRGLRGAALAEMAPAGAPAFTIEARLLPDPDLPELALRTGTQPAAPERRLLRINGATAPLARLADWARLLWLTPAMDRLFADAASARRRFLDRLVLALEPGHAAHVSRYEAAMRARNRLLAQDAPPDPAWLSALEAQMAAHGAALAAARERTVAALAGALASAPEDGFPRPLLALDGNSAEDLALRLAAGRSADRAAGRTLAGPHRADLVVHHAGTGRAAATSSTGEQKALLVSMLLAHAALVGARTGRTPLLLLDEAVAHLDPERRHALFARLAALGGQSWLSGTEPGLFAGLDAARFAVRDGAVGPA